MEDVKFLISSGLRYLTAVEVGRVGWHACAACRLGTNSSSAWGKKAEEDVGGGRVHLFHRIIRTTQARQ